MNAKHYAFLNTGLGFVSALVWWVPIMFGGMGGANPALLLTFFFGGYGLLFVGVTANWVFAIKAVNPASFGLSVWKILSFFSIPVYVLIVGGLLLVLLGFA
jgi:hypothetical protein